jgi:predicted nucleic acid-binding protein
MMIVVDASVWVSYLLPQDIHHFASEAWLDGYIQGGGKVAAPMLLLVEIAGAIRRRTGDMTLARQAIGTLANLPELSLVELDQSLSLTAANLAATLALRGADTLYVTVAQALQAPLVTWDQEQLTRAGQLIQTRTPL